MEVVLSYGSLGAINLAPTGVASKRAGGVLWVPGYTALD